MRGHGRWACLLPGREVCGGCVHIISITTRDDGSWQWRSIVCVRLPPMVAATTGAEAPSPVSFRAHPTPTPERNHTLLPLYGSNLLQGAAAAAADGSASSASRPAEDDDGDGDGGGDERALQAGESLGHHGGDAVEAEEWEELVGLMMAEQQQQQLEVEVEDGGGPTQGEEAPAPPLSAAEAQAMADPDAMVGAVCLWLWLGGLRWAWRRCPFAALLQLVSRIPAR